MSDRINVKNMSVNRILNSIYWDHYDELCTVYIDFIVEAIENTIQDFKNKAFYSLDDVYKHIIENYI